MSNVQAAVLLSSLQSLHQPIECGSNSLSKFLRNNGEHHATIRYLDAIVQQLRQICCLYTYEKLAQ